MRCIHCSSRRPCIHCSSRRPASAALGHALAGLSRAHRAPCQRLPGKPRGCTCSAIACSNEHAVQASTHQPS